MKGFIFTLSLVAGAEAIITPCCFRLDSSGAVVGTVGQLDDGQLRINGPLQPAEFCITDEGIWDVHLRGCIFTRT
jgi:hypothetical protein